MSVIIINNDAVNAVKFLDIPIVKSGQITIDDAALGKDVSLNIDFLSLLNANTIKVNNGSIDLVKVDALRLLRSEIKPIYEVNIDDKSTSNGTYTRLANFFFQGSDNIGIPTVMKVYYTFSGTNFSSRFSIRIINKSILFVFAYSMIFSAGEPSRTTLFVFKPESLSFLSIRSR